MKQWLVRSLLFLSLLFLWGHAAPAQAQQNQQEVNLIEGLDGGEYEPYAPSVIEQVQEALQANGLYDGEVNGVLDEATMQALGEFQEQSGLQVCGVPTPNTRRVLLEGVLPPTAMDAPATP